MAITKIISENPFVDTLLYCVKLLAYGAILKDQEAADNAETVASIKAADLYIASLENRAIFELFTYSESILRAAGIPKTLIADCLKSNNLIPVEYRSTLVTLMMAYTISNYEELNEYYRKLMGLPKIGDAGIPIADYAYLIPSGNTYSGTYVHELGINGCKMLDLYGILDVIKAANPTAEYLNYVTLGITSYTARKSLNFQILYLPTTSVPVIDDKYRSKFEINRQFVLRTLYSEAYKFESDYYVSFMMFFTTMLTMLDMITEVQEHIVKKDILDARCIEFIFSMYGIPYYHDIPLKYQINMVKNVNELVKYKSCKQGMLNLCTLFGFDDIQIMKYYLLRDRKIDSYGNYLYNRVTNITSEENDTIVNLRTDLSVSGYNMKIPFPFADYLAKGNVVFIRLDEKLLHETTDYTIYNYDMVGFTNSSILNGKTTITFDFYYDKTTINETYAIDKTNSILMVKQTINNGNNSNYKFDLTPPYANYFKDGNKIIVSIGSIFINYNDFALDFDANTIEIGTDMDIKNRKITIIYLYGASTTATYRKEDVIATSNMQTVFTIPEPFTNYVLTGNEFFINIGSLYIDSTRYTIINNTQIQLSEGVLNGLAVTFNFIYVQSTDYLPVNLIVDKVAITATEYYQHDFNITLPFPTYLDTGYKIYVEVYGGFLEAEAFEIYENQISFRDKAMSLQPGQTFNIYYIYTQTNKNTVAEATYQAAKYDNQVEFTLDYPLASYFDRGGELIVDNDGTYLDSSKYTINGNTLTIKNTDNAVTLGKQLCVIFLYTKNNAYNIKVTPTIVTATSNNQSSFYLKWPFYDYMESGNNFLIMYHTLLIESSRYTIDGFNIIFNDLTIPNGDCFTVLFIYSNMYIQDAKKLIVETRTIDVNSTIEDELAIPIPVPFNDYIEHYFPYFVDYSNQLIHANTYEAINNSLLFFDLNDILKYPTLTFTFIYKSSLLIKTVTEDYAKDISLKFISIPLKDDIHSMKYIKNKTNQINYDSITLDDPFWDGELNQDNQHEAIKAKILAKEFNYARTKYMTVNYLIDLTAMSFEISYFYNMFYDDVFKEELLQVQVPSISPNKYFKVSYLFCYMTALSYEFKGIKDSIMDTPTKIMYIKGFNFKADLNALRQYILDNRRLIKDYNVFDFLIPNGQIPSLGELVNIFTTNKKVYQLICTSMINCRDYDQYCIWKTLYDSLMTLQFNLEFFKLNNGTVAKTFTAFLQEKDPVLYTSLMTIKAISDSETKENTIVNMLSDIVYILDEYIPSDEFKYIYKDMPGISRDYVMRYLFKMINFFKSYKIMLYEMDVQYTLNDPSQNMIRPMDKMIMTSKLTKLDQLNLVEKKYQNQTRTFKDGVSLLERISITPYYE